MFPIFSVLPLRRNAPIKIKETLKKENDRIWKKLREPRRHHATQLQYCFRVRKIFSLLFASVFVLPSLPRLTTTTHTRTQHTHTHTHTSNGHFSKPPKNHHQINHLPFTVQKKQQTQKQTQHTIYRKYYYKTMEKVDQAVKQIDDFIAQYPSATQFGKFLRKKGSFSSLARAGVVMMNDGSEPFS